ncbi:MAG: Trehalose/maltose import ATP-binding protein MalK [Methanomassiliicoccales archaeon PtaU1.Bin124]|nr:MAG: Trehalose/maltose import ATP-binding protein MalK [Methanomassiliicoccales archaeon PtaU1.Bin124]
MEAIIIEGLVKSYGPNVAVDHANLHIDEGTVFGLIGPNGAGKTTILRSLLGIIPYDSGKVLVSGTDMRRANPQLKLKIGYLPQRAAFQEWKTTEQVLLSLGRLSGLEKTYLKERVDEVLELLGIEEYRSRKVGKLSGGTMQKLGFAQAILHEPSVLILDEPMAALDPSSRFLFKKIIKESRALGTTILFSSHILSDIEDLADSVGLLQQGKVRYSGTIAGLKKEVDLRSELMVEVVDDKGEWASVRLPGVDIRQPSPGYLVVHLSDVTQWDVMVPKIMEALMNAGCHIRSFNRREPNLEDVYMAYVGGSN